MDPCQISPTKNHPPALVHATFYASTKKYPPAPTADLIIPIGSLANNSGAQVFVPPSLTVNFLFLCNRFSLLKTIETGPSNRPSERGRNLRRNVCIRERAGGILGMHSTRHQRSSRKLSDQPFNIPDKYLGDLPENTTYGKGGFREARLLVDGQLAGVAFPYVVIYTGGFTPAAWRWVVSYLLA